MGNRASVSFKNGDNKSVAVFHHWGGEEFHAQAEAFAKSFRVKYPAGGGDPFSRREPNVVLVQFIQSLEKDDYSIYLGKDQNDGDNSDAGHLTVNLI